MERRLAVRRNDLRVEVDGRRVVIGSERADAGVDSPSPVIGFEVERADQVKRGRAACATEMRSRAGGVLDGKTAMGAGRSSRRRCGRVYER
jgi:hypothetical protein